MVVDSSAVLAVIQGEAGSAGVAALLREASICSINVAEVIGRLASLGGGREDIEAIIDGLGVKVVDADYELGISAGMLRPITDRSGLSLGDRFCLALGKRLDCEVLTADRAWRDVADDVGVLITLIR